MVLGAEVVTGDGRVLHFGGRVVKNVAGYDITRLLVCSRGSLALITALYVRLRAQPEHDLTLRATLREAADAVDLAAEVRQRMEADALEVIGPALTLAFSTADERGEWSVVVRVRGSMAATAEATEQLTAISRDFVKLDPPRASAIWQDLSMREARASIAFRFAHLPASLGQTFGLVRQIVANTSSDNEMDGEARWRIAAHGASGIVRLWADSAANLDADSLSEALARAAAQIVSGGGTVTCPVLPPGLPVPDLPVPPEADVRIGRALKERFDPAGVMSPGRHLVGL
jgi:FAD/FMN-containing dehydrogenase